MKMKYSLVRSFDGIASILRALGLHPVTRKCRNFVARIFSEGITIDVNGLRLCGSIRDRAFLYKVKEGSFEPETAKLFSETVKPGMVVLDIGAYLGYYSLLAARQVGLAGKVYAFEPDPLNYHWLEHNIHINGYANIIAVRKAVSNQSCLMHLYRHPDDPSMSSLLARHGCERGVTVEGTSLDEFLDEKRVDVVKLDIEGMEIQALRGMKGIIERSHTLTLFVELNPLALSEGGSSPEDLLSQIRKLGLDRIIRLDEQRNSQGELELCNLCCSGGS
jgi:FkbM family methyltransferase